MNMVYRRTHPQASSIPNGLAVVSDGACWCVLHPEQRLRSRDSVPPRVVVLSPNSRGDNEVDDMSRLVIPRADETIISIDENGDLMIFQEQQGTDQAVVLSASQKVALRRFLNDEAAKNREES